MLRLFFTGLSRQQKRQRKRAAANCRSLTQFMPPEKKGFEEVSGPSTNIKDSSPPLMPGNCESITCKAGNGVDQAPSDDTLSDMLSNAHTEIADGPNCSLVAIVCPSQYSHLTPEVTDIGSLFLKEKSSQDFRSAMNKLSVVHKFFFLKKYAYNTLVAAIAVFVMYGFYSIPGWFKQVDGAFCIACAIFCSDSSKGAFVNKPFRVWNKKSEKVREHENSLYHQRAG